VTGQAPPDKTDTRNTAPAGILYCDLDGVIWRGSTPIAGSKEAIASLRRAHWRVVFVTNSSFSVLGDQEDKLAMMGIPAKGDVVTSAQAGALLVNPGETVLVCGGPGIIEAVIHRGAKCVDVRDALLNSFDVSTIDAVIVGFHQDFCFDYLKVGVACVHRGARLIGTNDDAMFPTAEGELPGGGAILAAFSYATQTVPQIAGKPHREMADMVRSVVQVQPNTPQIMVGDRPSTDGAFASALGVRYAQVWSGVTSEAPSPIDGVEYHIAGANLAEVVRKILGESS